MSSIALGSLLWFMGSFVARNERESRNYQNKGPVLMRDQLPRFQVPATMNAYDNDWIQYEKEKQKAQEEQDEKRKLLEAEKINKAKAMTKQSSDEMYGYNPTDFGMDALLKPQLALFTDLQAAQSRADTTIPESWHGPEVVKGGNNINREGERMTLLNGEVNPTTNNNRESYSTILGPQDTLGVAPSDIALQYSYAAQTSSNVDNDARPVEQINDGIEPKRDFIDMDRIAPKSLEERGVLNKMPEAYTSRYGVSEAPVKPPTFDLSNWNVKRSDDKERQNHYLQSKLDRTPFQGDVLTLPTSRSMKDRDMQANRARYQMKDNLAADPNLAARLMNRGDFGSRRKALVTIPRSMYQDTGDVTGVLDTTPRPHEGDVPQLQNKELMLRGPRLIQNFKVNPLYIRSTMPLKPTMKQFNVENHPGYIHTSSQPVPSMIRMPRTQTKQTIKEQNTLQNRLDGFGTNPINSPLHSTETSRPMKRKEHDVYREEIGQQSGVTDLPEQGIQDHLHKRQQFRHFGNSKTIEKPYLIQGQSDRNTQITNAASIKNSYGIEDDDLTTQINPYIIGTKA